MPKETLEIYIIGLASQKLVKTITTSKHNTENLMFYLRDQGIPVASSCLGEGVCGKCVLNDELMSCQITVEAFLQGNMKNLNDPELQPLLNFCKKLSIPDQCFLIFISYL